MSAAQALNWNDAEMAAPMRAGGKRRATPRSEMTEISNVFVHAPAAVNKPSQARQQQSTCPWGTDSDVVTAVRKASTKPMQQPPQQQQENTGPLTARQEAAAIKARNSNSSGMSGILG